MAESVKKSLQNNLQHHLKGEELQNVVKFLAPKFVLKTKYRKDSEELQGALNSQLDQTSHLLEYIHTQYEQIQDLNEKLKNQNNLRSDAMSTDDESSMADSTEKSDNDCEYTSGETEVKQLIDQVKDKDSQLQQTEENLKKTNERLNRIKKQLGLKKEATIEEMETRIIELKKKGSKEAQNYKDKLEKAQEDYNQLKETVDDLKQDKTFLEIKLRNKETILRRMKTLKERKPSTAVNDRRQQSFYRRRPTENIPGLAVAPLHCQQIVMSARSNTRLPELEGPEEQDNFCMKCLSKLDSSVYCSGCVKHVLYKNK